MIHIIQRLLLMLATADLSCPMVSVMTVEGASTTRPSGTWVGVPSTSTAVTSGFPPVTTWSTSDTVMYTFGPPPNMVAPSTTPTTVKARPPACTVLPSCVVTLESTTACPGPVTP